MTLAERRRPCVSARLDRVFGQLVVVQVTGQVDAVGSQVEVTARPGLVRITLGAPLSLQAGASST
jgi:hypothetical protein